MAANCLYLNNDKTEVLLIGFKYMLKTIPDVVLKVRNDTIVPTDTARNIGAILKF